MVVDGGSSDETVEVLRRDHSDVEVLQGEGELWWTGAMYLGIAHALANSRSDDDMLLMMNNDTEVGPEYVETLVHVSRDKDAAVGALIVDSQDPTRILDAGEFIDWRNYSFPAKTTVQPGETFFDGVDVLPGRGSLVPLRMIRIAGNVDPKVFPHYIADYEFFVRLKRNGFRLGVTYATRIRSHVEETGLWANTENLPIHKAWAILFSRKSMENVWTHWRFIDRCAPADLRVRLKIQLARQYLGLMLFRTKLRFLVLPLVSLRRWLATMKPSRWPKSKICR
jgi:GT2 family glycosyltransferase